MRDGPGRRSIKKLALAFFNLHLALHRWQAKRHGLIRYELSGSCQQSGQCCEAPGIQVRRIVWYVPTLRRIFLWWQRRINGFELRETLREHRAFVFECTHFDRTTRQCDSYHSRPGMCRDYPRLLLQQADPQLFPRCGFKVLLARRASMLEELARHDLSPEQLAKLRRGLNLGEGEEN